MPDFPVQMSKTPLLSDGFFVGWDRGEPRDFTLPHNARFGQPSHALE